MYFLDFYVISLFEKFIQVITSVPYTYIVIVQEGIIKCYQAAKF